MFRWPEDKEATKNRRASKGGQLTFKVKRIAGSHCCQKPHELKRGGLRKRPLDLSRYASGGHSVRGYGQNEQAQGGGEDNLGNSFKKLGDKDGELSEQRN